MLGHFYARMTEHLGYVLYTHTLREANGGVCVAGNVCSEDLFYTAEIAISLR